MTKLILVRHCQAEGNLKRFFQGKTDSDITPLGSRQIAAAAELLSAEPIDVFYTSSLQRARKTTDGINIYHMQPVITDDRISEINAGLWEGRLLTDIEREFPAEYQNWNDHPEIFAAPGGESMAEVYDRVGRALEDIIRENKDKTVCIVSHGCAIKNMMCWLSGLPLQRIAEVPLGTNTSVNVVTVDDNMNKTVLISNYTEHLALIH